MSDKIIFVDDEPHILDSMKRQLRKRYNIATALSGPEALKKFKEQGPFSVIVADMRMPVMDGIQLLETVRKLYPDTVRLMLTGNADQETAIDAVNKGQIFRFLNKPCPISVLITSLALALRQYKLVTVEKELLDQTLKESLKVLSELLSFANPTAFRSGVRIRSLVARIAQELSLHNMWQLEIAALLSQIGCVTLPKDILIKIYSNEELEPEEVEMYGNHPQIGARMLENIPRMQGVAYIIRNQLKLYDEFDNSDKENEEVNLGAQILKAVYDYDLLLFQGMNHVKAIQLLQEKTQSYHPEILKLMARIRLTDEITEIVSLNINDIAVGMVVEEDVLAKNNTLLASKGQEITRTVLQGLVNFSRQVGVREPVRVRVVKR
jgi:response regulator RpfG family c-di-GMP phosphodiesterase